MPPTSKANQLHTLLLSVTFFFAKLQSAIRKSPAIAAKMSDGEIEVETVSGYQVLPKDVVAEIGSVKLFSTPMPPESTYQLARAQKY